MPKSMKDKVQELLEIADLENKSGNFKKAIASYLQILEIPDIDDRAKHLSY